MANVVYALLIEDLTTDVDRQRLDDALAGKITIRPDEVQPIARAPETVAPILPNARNMDELREQWGRDPDAIRAKLQFDQTMKGLPPQRPRNN